MLDTGLARPPSPTYTAITPTTRAPERNEPAARTELPAENTVRPSSETEDGQPTNYRARAETSRFEDTSSNLERRHIVDPESESVIYVATNTETGEIVRQVPSETLRRLRAYSKAIASQDQAMANQGVQRTV
ncbi:hypothetical protein LP7551_00801 [Roseibium album]|nr:hypothetical protein LP7551_00801 [Roseibium album]